MNINTKNQLYHTATSIYRTFVFPFVKWYYVLKYHIQVLPHGYFDHNTKLSLYDHIGRFTFLDNCEVGINVGIGDNVHFIRTKIGNYCQIGRGTIAAIGEHRFRDGFATSSSFFSKNPGTGLSLYQTEFTELKLADPENGWCIVLENDVWVGAGSILFSGITLANGTVIGAGSIVTKSTEPYGIYMGSPAKLVAYRFDEEKRKELLESKWWDKSFDELREFAKKYG